MNRHGPNRFAEAAFLVLVIALVLTTFSPYRPQADTQYLLFVLPVPPTIFASVLLIAMVAGAMSGFALLLWLARYTSGQSIRDRRLSAGLCVACGYDLRGGHERCPECGEPVLSSQA